MTSPIAQPDTKKYYDNSIEALDAAEKIFTKTIQEQKSTQQAISETVSERIVDTLNNISKTALSKAPVIGTAITTAETIKKIKDQLPPLPTIPNDPPDQQPFNIRSHLTQELSHQMTFGSDLINTDDQRSAHLLLTGAGKIADALSNPVTAASQAAGIDLESHCTQAVDKTLSHLKNNFEFQEAIQRRDAEGDAAAFQLLKNGILTFFSHPSSTTSQSTDEKSLSQDITIDDLPTSKTTTTKPFSPKSPRRTPSKTSNTKELEPPPPPFYPSRQRNSPSNDVFEGLIDNVKKHRGATTRRTKLREEITQKSNFLLLSNPKGFISYPKKGMFRSTERTLSDGSKVVFWYKTNASLPAFFYKHKAEVTIASCDPKIAALVQKGLLYKGDHKNHIEKAVQKATNYLEGLLDQQRLPIPVPAEPPKDPSPSPETEEPAPEEKEESKTKKPPLSKKLTEEEEEAIKRQRELRRTSVLFHGAQKNLRHNLKTSRDAGRAQASKGVTQAKQSLTNRGIVHLINKAQAENPGQQTVTVTVDGKKRQFSQKKAEQIKTALQFSAFKQLETAKTNYAQGTSKAAAAHAGSSASKKVGKTTSVAALQQRGGSLVGRELANVLCNLGSELCTEKLAWNPKNTHIFESEDLCTIAKEEALSYAVQIAENVAHSAIKGAVKEVSTQLGSCMPGVTALSNTYMLGKTIIQAKSSEEAARDSFNAISDMAITWACTSAGATLCPFVGAFVGAAASTIAIRAKNALITKVTS